MQISDSLLNLKSEVNATHKQQLPNFFLASLETDAAAAAAALPPPPSARTNSYSRSGSNYISSYISSYSSSHNRSSRNSSGSSSGMVVVRQRRKGEGRCHSDKQLYSIYHKSAIMGIRHIDSKEDSVARLNESKLVWCIVYESYLS
jgi:hypothetical protein